MIVAWLVGIICMVDHEYLYSTNNVIPANTLIMLLYKMLSVQDYFQILFCNGQEAMPNSGTEGFYGHVVMAGWFIRHDE